MQASETDRKSLCSVLSCVVESITKAQTAFARDMNRYDMYPNSSTGALPTPTSPPFLETRPPAASFHPVGRVRALVHCRIETCLVNPRFLTRAWSRGRLRCGVRRCAGAARKQHRFTASHSPVTHLNFPDAAKAIQGTGQAIDVARDRKRRSIVGDTFIPLVLPVYVRCRALHPLTKHSDRFLLHTTRVPIVKHRRNIADDHTRSTDIDPKPIDRSRCDAKRKHR
jgi:hypothetical protein